MRPPMTTMIMSIMPPTRPVLAGHDRLLSGGQRGDGTGFALYEFGLTADTVHVVVIVNGAMALSGAYESQATANALRPAAATYTCLRGHRRRCRPAISLVYMINDKAFSASRSARQKDSSALHASILSPTLACASTRRASFSLSSGRLANQTSRRSTSDELFDCV